LLTRETFQVVNVAAGAHDHFEGRDHLTAGCAIASGAK